MANGKKISDIIKFVKPEIKNIEGDYDEFEIMSVNDMGNVNEYSLDWISSNCLEKQKAAELSKARFIIVDEKTIYSEKMKEENKVLIVVKNPKLILAKIITEFFVQKHRPQISNSAIIHKEAIIGKNVDIGSNVYVGKCIIGDNVNILANSYIYDNTIIKNNVEIHNGVSIGSEAHNFIKDEHGNLIKFPHIGKVIIEDNVLVGANSVVSRGVLGDTIIRQGSKIAQLVFIGANNVVGENCAIRPNVMTSGSVIIGNASIIAPSVTIREFCSIGNNCIIGMGSVVVQNIPDNEIWFGNPAKRRG